MSANHCIEPIGWISSPFKQKFGAPRQAGEVAAAEGFIRFASPYQNPDAFREIEGFSHLWLIYQFHLTKEKGWTPLIRPPRLGGNTRVGVFASRSPFRPNSLGLSVVENLGIRSDTKQGILLHVRGIDMVDQSPIFDIKPYLSHSDSVPSASIGYSPPELKRRTTVWHCDYLGQQRELIEQTLSLDPRPGYKDDSTEHKTFIGDENVIWKVQDHCVQIIKVEPASQVSQYLKA
jgi:tRNA (adenine37-N6)-methyltransferase